MFRLFFLVLLSSFAPFASAQQPAERVDPALQIDPERDRFDFANQFFDAGQKARAQFDKDRYHRRSTELFSAFIRDFPRSQLDASARYRLGVSLMVLGQPADAKREFRALVRRHPQDELAGLASYRMGSLEWAERDFRAAAPHFATCAAIADGQLRQRALFFQGSSHLQLQENASARDAFLGILAEPQPFEPYTSRANLQVGLLEQDRGEHENALQYLLKLFGANVSAAERGPAMLAAGQSYLKLEQPDVAGQTFEKILKSPDLQKWHTSAQASLMAAAYQKEDYPRVLDIYRASPIAGKGEPIAKLHLIAGKAANKTERYPDAIRYFALAERALPQSDLAFDAAYRRLLCFFNIEGANVPDQVDAFLSIYRPSHAASPYIQSARLMKAETFFSEKKYAQAAEVYNEINSTLIDDQNRPGLLFHKGWCLAESGDPNGAIHAFSRFIGDFPDHPNFRRALAKRGESYLAAQDYDKAIRDFDRIASDPDSPLDLVALALQKSAMAALEKKDFARVVSDFGKLLERFPDLKAATRANAHYSIGHAHMKLEQFEPAAESMDQARDLDSETFAEPAGTKIALCYYMLKDAESLLTAVERLERDVPGKVLPERMLTWLGIKSFERRDFTNAARYLKRTIDHETPEQTKPFIWRQYAKASLQTGDYDEALAATNHVLEVEENAVSLADAYLDKGRALLALSRFAEAIEAAEEGQRKQPRGLLNAELNILLGDIAFKREDFTAALKYYGTTAEFIADQRLKPIALAKARIAAQRKGDDALAESYQKLLQQNFPDFEGLSDWP